MPKVKSNSSVLLKATFVSFKNIFEFEYKFVTFFQLNVKKFDRY